ncbi:hypothetical protein BDB00DRAFT_787031 [Zychaea mexicana]|uniref:uncharacterized protein n=1 Tax=Zychaea mexicana TaxID=64656 RepID=UPI0022FF28FB|nr:uncharacterized protein BDB00DRAFT_787031 [Zychaea mexicana]KAI9494685.1 hypothetical protein BDB00DRAFT_787031 [Zychaea mexicana]
MGVVVCNFVATGTVRNSLIATTRPVSRRWKKLVTKIKALRKRDNHCYYDDNDEDDEDMPDDDRVAVAIEAAKKMPALSTTTSATAAATTVIERRHSSDELKRKAGFPYYTEEPADDERRVLDRPQKRKDSASLSAMHHISMPAGPVCSSALSPPPRHTMNRRKLVEPSPAARPPVIVRLSIDLHEQDVEESEHLDEMHPFRSGTLGNTNDGGGFTIPAPVPDIPLKERRKRRSPLSIPDDLTLSLKKKPSLHHQKSNTSIISSTASSVTSTSSSAISVERSKAMNALEGLDRDKAQYDAVVGRRRATANTPTTATSGTVPMVMNNSSHHHLHYNEPTPSLTPSSRPIYYPSSPSSVGTVVEETVKFSIATTTASQSPSPSQASPLPSTRIPESLRHYRDL